MNFPTPTATPIIPFPDTLLDLTNISVVAGNEQETNTNDNSDSVVTNIDRLINLTVDKSGPATIQAGSGPGNLVYTVDVTDDGRSGGRNN